MRRLKIKTTTDNRGGSYMLSPTGRDCSVVIIDENGNETPLNDVFGVKWWVDGRTGRAKALIGCDAEIDALAVFHEPSLREREALKRIRHMVSEAGSEGWLEGSAAGCAAVSVASIREVLAMLDDGIPKT